MLIRGGYRSFKETFVDKLANQPYKKTKLGKDFKIENSCLECDWFHNTFYERDADGNYYEITEPKEFEAPLDYYEKWQYGTRNFLENNYSDGLKFNYNITTQPQELGKQKTTEDYYFDPRLDMYVKRRKVKGAELTGTDVRGRKLKYGGSMPKYQTAGEKRYTPSMNTQQPLISWSTLQKDYPELYQKIINADPRGVP